MGTVCGVVFDSETSNLTLKRSMKVFTKITLGLFLAAVILAIGVFKANAQSAETWANSGNSW